MHKKIKPAPASGCYLQFLSSADEFHLEEKIKKKRGKYESSVNFIKSSIKPSVHKLYGTIPGNISLYKKVDMIGQKFNTLLRPRPS